MGYKAAVKVWANTPEKAKEALCMLQSKGYDATGLERLTLDSAGWQEVGFFGHSNGAVGFTKARNYFTERPFSLLIVKEPELERPPIGLAPAYIWKAQRVGDIFAAMVRYNEAGKVIPSAWINELAELQQKEGV